MRELWVRIHRYAGLAMAAFLVVAGLTGSLLAFLPELEATLAPELHRVPVRPAGVEALDPFALREALTATLPEARVDWVPLHVEPGSSLAFFAEPRDLGADGTLEQDEFFFDPYDGRLLGSRKWGDVADGPESWMPFVYRLHYSLAIPGRAGTWLFGVAALVWTLDCFVGFYLTLPRRRPGAPGGEAARKAFSSRWGPAWRIRWRSRSFWRVNFDVHRAIGLWLWLAFFVFAWSAVGLNLGGEVYHPVMDAVFGDADPYGELPEARERRAEPVIAWREAHAIARRHAADQARIHGFTVIREDGLGYDPEKDVYRYRLKTDRDVYDRFAHVNLWFDAASGAFRAIELPSGQSTGDAITAWLYALHFGAVFGLPYRIFVAAFGVAVTLLTVSGVLVWWKKRSGRALRRRTRAVVIPREGSTALDVRRSAAT